MAVSCTSVIDRSAPAVHASTPPRRGRYQSARSCVGCHAPGLINTGRVGSEPPAAPVGPATEADAERRAGRHRRRRRHRRDGTGSAGNETGTPAATGERRHAPAAASTRWMRRRVGEGRGCRRRSGFAR